MVKHNHYDPDYFLDLVGSGSVPVRTHHPVSNTFLIGLWNFFFFYHTPREINLIARKIHFPTIERIRI